MEAFNEEIKNYVTKYKAIDGTIFNDQAECVKYENTAKCVIKAKFNKLIVNDKYDAWDLMGGYEDNQVLAIKMKDEKDKDVVLQMMYMEYSHILQKGREELKKAFDDKVDSAFNNDGVILWGMNQEGDYYLIDSRHDIVERLMGLDKE